MPCADCVRSRALHGCVVLRALQGCVVRCARFSSRFYHLLLPPASARSPYRRSFYFYSFLPTSTSTRSYLPVLLLVPTNLYSTRSYLHILLLVPTYIFFYSFLHAACTCSYLLLHVACVCMSVEPSTEFDRGSTVCPTPRDSTEGSTERVVGFNRGFDRGSTDDDDDDDSFCPTVGGAAFRSTSVGGLAHFQSDSHGHRT